VRAAFRRTLGSGPSPRGLLQRGELVIDFDRRRVHRGELEIRLTPKEFELLSLLATHAGRVLTHRSLLQGIWGTRVRYQPEHLRVLVGQLRKKIEPDPAHPRFVLTEPWVGYRLADDPE
jgi:two-component system KDP operon response regulator KdpE